MEGDLAQTLMTALGITDVPDIEEEEEEEPSAGNWLSNMVPPMAPLRGQCRINPIKL
ncbi:MAG: hypothetical protein H6925_04590 [Holosporaceae bacterium]|nr:MAG: hypothetical protein H6925_04590 [Holosporaceae bacterium]